MESYLLELALRWAHILAAITAVGGSVFARYALVPVLATLPEDQRRELHESIRARWAPFVHASIAVLLLTGFYNFLVVIGPKNVGRDYHMIFGIKFLLAIALFGLASVLMGRSARAQKMRANAKTWLLVNVSLAVMIVCLSGILRSLPHKPRETAPAAPAVKMPSESPAPGKTEK